MVRGDEIQHFSYAAPDDPRLKRLVIRAIETMTGQPYLKSLYDAHRLNPVPGESFWSAAMRNLELSIRYNEEGLAKLPKTGPLVIVANHPFGVLDGLIISYLTSLVRNDFLVLTNSVLYQADEIREHLLPIDFAETKEALTTNLKSRAAAKTHLLKGGVLVVFPAGGASTAPKMWSKRAVDAEWKNFARAPDRGGQGACRAGLFRGTDSRLFQIASHISMTLRLSLFFKEVYDKIGSELHVRIGDLIPYSDLDGMDRTKLMEHLAQEDLCARRFDPASRIRGRRPARARRRAS
jgi:putative hemolysin